MTQLHLEIMRHVLLRAVTPRLFLWRICLSFSFLYSLTLLIHTKESIFFLLLPFYITGNVFCQTLKTLTNRKMATATSTTNNNDIPSNYHTVTISADLPKIDKYYNIEKMKDLPSADYWLNKMDNKSETACYKVQHIIANGPRE